MLITPEALVALPPRETLHRYTIRDTLLYALGVGAGADPEDFQYVYEDGLQVLPTMAVTLAYPGFWLKEPQFGVDWKRALHAEQSIIIHAPLPSEGYVRGETVVEQVVDKGEAKGAIIVQKRTICDVASGALLATVRQLSFMRGDGGCGNAGPDGPPSSLKPVPDRAPDAVHALGTRPEQAFIYRLSGDYNPLHVDPKVAREAGLEAPILHGLCSYGVAGRALVRMLCNGNPTLLRRMDCRLTAPVFPGETIEVAAWRLGVGQAAFQARVVERNVVVLAFGSVEFEA